MGIVIRLPAGLVGRSELHLSGGSRKQNTKRGSNLNDVGVKSGVIIFTLVCIILQTSS